MPGKIWTDSGKMQDLPEPEALTRAQIKDVVRDYAEATATAMKLGFDGVELHCASGYLPHQFLSDNVNLRTDEYGGAPAHRIRFVTEVLQGMIDSARRADRVGIKISPQATFNDIREDHAAAVYHALVEALNPLSLAYLQVKLPTELAPALRQQYRGVFMLGGGLTDQTGEDLLRTGAADLVAYGTSFLANPDLPHRFQHQTPLNKPRPATFYSAGPQGYNDYPIVHH
jgi:N-ethylmaleimide reductase